ncbi:hypothetical protein HDU97_000393 [Phlyctochytrium planicorne]|nr:hypothetical protein HDU97_000393 [Phlyctochytrium planicorne]
MLFGDDQVTSEEVIVESTSGDAGDGCGNPQASDSEKSSVEEPQPSADVQLLQNQDYESIDSTAVDAEAAIEQENDSSGAAEKCSNDEVSSISDHSTQAEADTPDHEYPECSSDASHKCGSTEVHKTASISDTPWVSSVRNEWGSPKVSSESQKHWDANTQKDLNGVCSAIKTKPDDRPIRPLSNYVLGRRLGSGSYGSVHAVTDMVTGEKLCMKVIDVKHEPEYEVKTFEAVRGCCQLVQMVEWQFRSGQGVQAVEQECVIVMERFSMNLEEYVEQYGLTDRSFKFVAYQVLKAISHMHSLCIMHRYVSGAKMK